jgi:hypothetical protein
MSVFTEPEYRFTVRANDERVVSCQATNSLIITSADGKIKETVTADFQMPQGMVYLKKHEYFKTESVICGARIISEELFVVDRYRACVKVFLKNKKESTLEFTRSFGENILNQPVGIVLDKERDELYVADNENHRIVAFRTDGAFLLTLGSGYGQKPGQMFCPCGVAFYKNLIVIAEWGNGRLQMFKDGKSVLVINGMPHAHDIIINENGEGYVALYSHKAIAKFKITLNDDASPCFELCAERIQLEHNPTSLFFDEEGKLGVVTKTKLLKGIY